MQEEILEGCRINAVQVLAIRQAKLNEIQGALDDLRIIGMATGLYEKASTDMDYKTFENHIKETFEFSSGDTKSTFEKVNSLSQGMAPGESVYVGVKLSREDEKSKILDMLLSLDYIPPKDWREIVGHLELLQQYYRSDFDSFHPMLEFNLDVSLCKLLRIIGTVIERMDGNEISTG